MRTALVATMMLIAAGLMLAVGGCASNSSRDWAQTSPVIAPTQSGLPIVSLGVAEQGS